MEDKSEKLFNTQKLRKNIFKNTQLLRIRLAYSFVLRRNNNLIITV